MRLGVYILVSVNLMRTTNREKTVVACNDTRHRSQKESIRAAFSNLQCVGLSADIIWGTCMEKIYTFSVRFSVFSSTCNDRFFIMPTLMFKWAFILFSPFHQETSFKVQPHWKHTWTSCLTNNLPLNQVAVTNVSHLRKIALIVKESFTSYWEAICRLLFL